MKPEPALPRRALVLYDGIKPAPALVAACDTVGLELLPYVECMPFGTLPLLLTGPVSPWRLSLGLSADFSGYVETTTDGLGADATAWGECTEAACQGGIALSLTSATAYAHDVPAPFIAAIGRRHPDSGCLQAMEMALYEALANALIHGNLGIDSTLRGSAADLRDYRTALAHALADPALARRRVTMTCHPVADRLRLSVHDQGGGWDVDSMMNTAAAADAKSGRGLALIRRMADSIAAEDGGRCLIMEFGRRAA